MTETIPSEDRKDFALVLMPWVKDEDTGAMWLHKDYVQFRQDWVDEQHVGPVEASESFGDIPSWVDYVKRFAGAPDLPPLLTWNSQGLRGVLDYHEGITEPGRCQWIAAHPFERSPEWRAWESFANGGAKSPREAIERLEDLGEDIVEPAQIDLTKMLRDLRAGATAKADTEIRPDGTSNVTFTKDTTVRTKSDVELPPVIRVAIPVLVGDTTRWEIKVRMRVSVDDSAKLTFRFSLVNAERILEAVYAERVQAAKDLLGEDYALLRAAG